MHTPSATALLPHTDAALPSRLAASVLATSGEVMSDAQFFDWLAGRQRKHAQQVRRIPFAELSGWDFDQETGDLQHRSGRFYSVRGLKARSDGPAREWIQPIISQPEIGVLGVAVREINGVLHCLMQAKSEPGNLNGVQLSPTVQATKSNYTRVHGGSAVPYLDCFRNPDPRRHRVLADTLQSEQGSWFYRKRNRNMVVEVGSEVEAGEDFCWLSLRQVNSFLQRENLLNMDARTVLSCIPDWQSGTGGAIRRSLSLHSDVEIRSWITSRRSEREVSATLLPLRETEGRGWHRWDDQISHERGLYFSIIAVDVSSNRREVPAWTQPLLQPHGIGVVALLVKRFDGVLHALVQARAEPGYLDGVELAPSVQCTPENYAHLPDEDQPLFLDVVQQRRPQQTLFDTVLSEEGGRFHHAENRYLVVEVDEDFPATTSKDHRWMALGQLTELLKHGNYLNVQARTLVAALRTLPEAGGTPMQIVGSGFLGRNLADAFADRFPGVTALAAGVSSTAGTASADFDREADLLYEVLRQCRERHRSLIFFSTASAAMYGASDTPALEEGPVQPPSVYGRHKLALESVIRSAGVDHLILRLSHVVGRHQRSHQLLPSLVHQVMEGSVTVYQGAHRDLLDVRDLVHVIGRLLEEDVRGEVINVASGAPQPVEDIVDGIEGWLGSSAQRVHRPGPVSLTRVSTRRLRRLVPDFDTGRTTADYLDMVLNAYLPYYSAHDRAAGTPAGLGTNYQSP